jgi:hypothetical protein
MDSGLWMPPHGRGRGPQAYVSIGLDSDFLAMMTLTVKGRIAPKPDLKWQAG